MKEKVYINIKGLQLAAQNVPRDYEEDEDDGYQRQLFFHHEKLTVIHFVN